MTTGNLQDCSINIKPESVFKTAVTPDRAFEFTSETLDWTPTIVQGEGLKSGAYMPRSDRRVVPSGQGGGDITMDILSKGFGYWWQACMGTGVSTQLDDESDTTYQQNFTWSNSPSSLTVQKASVEAGGTIDAVTFAGVMVTQFVITFTNQGLVTLQVTLDAADYATDTAFASLTYASSASAFHFANWTMKTGSLTEPDTDSLGAGATAMTGVRSLTITGNRNPVVDRFNAGGSGRKDKQIGTNFDVTGSYEIEYNATTERDNYLNQTARSLVSTVEGAALSTGNETFQVILPAIETDGGGVPQSNGTGLIVQTVNFTALDNGSATEGMWICTRTADTAI